MAAYWVPKTSCRLVAAVLAISGALLAAQNKRPSARTAAGAETGDKSSINYNIPLWEEGKVPLAAGNGPLDTRFSPSSFPRKASGTAVP